MSAQTVGGAIRTIVIEGNTAVGENFFLDSAPEGSVPPYCTYNDGTTLTPSLRGDSKVQWYVRTIQIDIWQTQDHEDPTLPAAIRELLNGASVDVVGMPNKLALNVVSNNRLPEPIGSNLVHHEISLSLQHSSAVV